MPLPASIIPVPPRVRRKRHEPQAATAVTNVNLLRVIETIGGALLLMFDGAVTVDPASPPTTWSFNGQTSIQQGCINYGTSVYLILNGVVSPGDAVVIAADDPAARTPSGGYVNGGSMVVADM
jgi:hypothetical protein